MSSEESLKVITKGAGIVFASMFISKALTYFYRVIVARIGTEEYGLLSLGIAALGIASTLSLLGLSGGVSRYVPYYRGKEDEQRIKGTITSALKISAPSIVFLSSVMFFYSGWISVNLFHNVALVPILKILSFIVPFSALSAIFLATLVGFKKIEYYVFTKNIFESVILLIITIVLVYFGFGLLGATFAYALAIISTFLLSFYFLERKTFPIFRTKVKSIPMRRELFSYSWPLIFSAIFGMIIAWTDTLMIGYFLSTSEVGIYNAALPTAALMLLIPAALLSLFFPVVTELYSKGKKQELENVYKTTTKWIFFANFPMFLLMVIFSKQILRVLFGQEYIAAAFALSILTLAYFVNSLFRTSGAILSMIKKTKLLLLISIISAGSNVILNYNLIPIYGIAGGAIATGVSFMISGIFHGFFAYHFMKMQPITKHYLKSIASGIVSALVVYQLTRLLFTPTPLYALVLMFVLFLSIYILMLLMLRGFEEDDIEIIKAIQRKTGVDFTPINKVLKRFL